MEVEMCMRFLTHALTSSLRPCGRNWRNGKSPRLFSTKRSVLRGAEFFFAFFELVLPESSPTKRNSAPRRVFRLVENSLKPIFHLATLFARCEAKTRVWHRDWFKSAGEEIRCEQVGTVPTFLSVCASKVAKWKTSFKGCPKNGYRLKSSASDGCSNQWALSYILRPNDWSSHSRYMIELTGSNRQILQTMFIWLLPNSQLWIVQMVRYNCFGLQKSTTGKK